MLAIFRFFAAILLFAHAGFIPLAHAQFNTGGSGGVNSVQPGCGAYSTPNPITSSGVLGTNIPVSNVITSATYTIQANDACGLLVLGIGASVLTLPNAATPGFGANSYWRIDNQSGGSITINVTAPANIDGDANPVIVNATAVAFQSDGGTYHYVVKSAPGIGTVTSLSGGCGVVANPNPVVNAGSLSGSALPVTLTAATPPIQASYCGGVVRLSGSGDLVATIAQAGSSGFPAGWNITACNISAVAQSINATGGTVGGLVSYSLLPGTSSIPTCVGLVSDGVSDFNLLAGASGTVQSITAGCGNTASPGTITVSGNILSQLVENHQTAGYTVNVTDCGNVITLDSAATPTLTLPTANTAGFTAGYYTRACNINTGAWTATPSSGTVGGAANLTIAAGTRPAPTCVWLYPVSSFATTDWGVMK